MINIKVGDWVVWTGLHKPTAILVEKVLPHNFLGKPFGIDQRAMRCGRDGIVFVGTEKLAADVCRYLIESQEQFHHDRKVSEDARKARDAKIIEDASRSRQPG